MDAAPLVIGLDHIYLSVSDLPAAERFYDRVMRALGLRKGTRPIAGEPHVHYVCPALQITLRPARGNRPHDPYAPGLHHLCLQAPDRNAVDRAYDALRAAGVDASDPALYPQYNPEYYATFFEDPDGLRLELVARTSYRDELARDWPHYHHFVNPRAALEGERSGVFHIATDAAYQAAQQQGVYAPPSLAREGFIHCSTRAQVADTAARFFADREDLWLLRLDGVALAHELRYEGPVPPAPELTDALFPHLYGPLPLSKVLGAARLSWEAQGTLRWPDDPIFE